MNHEKFHQKFLMCFGAVYILLALFAYYNSFHDSGTAGVLWLSYTTFFLIGLGMFFKKPYLVASQLTIILIPYLFWTVDFFYILITGKNLFGIADYFFLYGPILPKLVSMQHLFTIPLSFLALYIMKLNNKNFWRLSALQIVVFYFATLFFTAKEHNINCVFENCLPFTFFNLPYPVYWFVLYAVMISVSAFVINWIFVRSAKRFTLRQKV